MVFFNVLSVLQVTTTDHLKKSVKIKKINSFHFFFRISRLRFRSISVVPRSRRVPGLLQDLRPDLAVQRQEQMDRGSPKTSAGSSSRSLRLHVRPSNRFGHFGGSGENGESSGEPRTRSGHLLRDRSCQLCGGQRCHGPQGCPGSL